KTTSATGASTGPSASRSSGLRDSSLLRSGAATSEGASTTTAAGSPPSAAVPSLPGSVEAECTTNTAATSARGRGTLSTGVSQRRRGEPIVVDGSSADRGSGRVTGVSVRGGPDYYRT